MDHSRFRESPKSHKDANDGWEDPMDDAAPVTGDDHDDPLHYCFLVFMIRLYAL